MLPGCRSPRGVAPEAGRGLCHRAFYSKLLLSCPNCTFLSSFFDFPHETSPTSIPTSIFLTFVAGFDTLVMTVSRIWRWRYGSGGYFLIGQVAMLSISNCFFRLRAYVGKADCLRWPFSSSYDPQVAEDISAVWMQLLLAMIVMAPGVVVPSSG